MDYRKAYGVRGGGRGSASAEPSSEAAAEGGVSSSLVTPVTTARTLQTGYSTASTVDYANNRIGQRSYWSEEEDDKSGKTQRRVRRAYHRFFTGAEVGGQLRFLTLTSSDEALSKGLDIHRSWTAVKMRLRRRLGPFEYFGVREVDEDDGRVHLHIVFRGSYIDQQLISHLWKEIHCSPVVDIRRVWNAGKVGGYLAKYLTKQIRNRYWQSYGWVFKGWVGWSRKVRQVMGYFPSRSILVTLARLDVERREVAQSFLLCRGRLAPRRTSPGGLLLPVPLVHPWGF